MKVHLSVLLAVCACTAASVTAQPLVRISEFLASNSTIVVPGREGATFDDWIEIHNAGTEAADLGGWSLTDNASNLAKWVFPAGTILAPNAYLVVLANNLNTPNANGLLQTNFALSASGEYLALVEPDGTVANEFFPGGEFYPPQSTDISYGLKPGDLIPVYFATPTPGAANSADGFVIVNPVQVSVERGYFTAPFNVTLSTTTSGATIYYTLDGSPPVTAAGAPTATATAFSSPIAISTTTVLRAAGTKAATTPSAIASQSYIFPQAVATQTRPAGYPTNWGGGGGGVTGDYDVDPDVSLSAEDAQRFQDGLRDIPTISVSASRDTLFGSGGLYVNSQSDSEKAVSAEYFHPSGNVDGLKEDLEFQIDCGIRMQGGASRNAQHKKHSMSLRFRDIYGASKLNADILDDPATSEFNSLQLRAMYNNSWIHGSGDQRARATMITDQWIRDSHIAMGNDDGGSGRYVHLFLNGMYWGVYNLHERPENDHYAEYSDGAYDKDEVFGYNPGNSTSAESSSFNQMKNAVSSGIWANVVARLDVDNYIDFYIGQHFGHNDDLKGNDNWRAAGGGPANAPWRFYPWDSERTLENPNNTGNLAITQDGANIIGGLVTYPEFRARFADRAYKHFHHGGALTNAANRVRFLARVAELDKAIVGESARWGDVKTSHDHTRSANWLPAIHGPLPFQPHAGVLGDGGWFPESGPNRTSIMIAAWKSQTWGSGLPTKIPATDPPQFMVNGVFQHGGTLPSGAPLTLSGGTGEIYYTTDGSDPRLEGGDVRPGLAPYAGGPIDPGSGLIKVRWKDGSDWSALNEAQFLVGSPAQPGDLRIVELHYNPAEPSALERVALAALDTTRVYSGEDFQFLEILNVSGNTLNLADCQLSVGVTFTFGNVSLAPGQRVVVVERLAGYAIRYPHAPAPAGQWSGALAKNGETVTLISADSAMIDSVTYSDSGAWPSRPDGDGPSLEIINPLAAANDPNNWRSSSEFHGTPGTAGSGPDKRILINEILANTASPVKDAIELVNTTGSTIDLSGWFLSDGKSQYRKFRIPNGTILGAGGHIAFDEAEFNNPTPLPVSGYSGEGGETAVNASAHGLATGDAVTISGYGGTGGYNGTWQIIVTGPNSFNIPTAFIDDAAAKGSWTPGQTFALSALGETVWLMEGGPGGELVSFVDSVSFPASLTGESMGRWPDALGPFVPLQTPTLGGPNSAPRVGPLLIAEIMFQPQSLPEIDFEFVEIWNPTASSQSLANWTLRGNVDYNFTSESIPAGGRLVVVGFNPADTAKRDAFLAAYGVDYPIAFAGPWNPGDTLSNTGGTVRLRRAGDPPDDEPGSYPLVIEDEVHYLASGPWPDATTGHSLNRIGSGSFGSDAASWTAVSPTPGRGELTGFALWAFENNLTGGATADSDGDGVADLIEYAFGLNPGAADSNLLPRAVLEGSAMVLAYPVDLGKDDIVILVEGSDDLDEWHLVDAIVIGAENGVETRKAAAPANADRYFMRFRVSTTD